MRVGILDLLGPPARRPVELGYQLLITKQYASITPQAISVWCRRMGHETFYATYYGLGRPHRLVPADLDVVFISCYTQVSHLAYALAKLYRKAGVRTVIGVRTPTRGRKAAQSAQPGHQRPPTRRHAVVTQPTARACVGSIAARTCPPSS